MNIPPSEHVVWKLVRVAVVGAIFLVNAFFSYQNPASKSDIIPLLTILLGVGGYDQIKSKLTKPGGNNESND